MVKDYFQDIVPPSDGPRRTRAVPVRKVAPAAEAEFTYDDDTVQTPAEEEMVHTDTKQNAPEASARGIRNINIQSRMGTNTRQMPPGGGIPPVRPHTRSSRLWIWILAAVCIVALIILGFVASRPTTVTVVPRSHDIVFDQTAQFVTYPALSAASGTLPYTVQTVDLDDSEVIAAQSTPVHTETKASGNITVYNDYSTSPVRLVATTRFETPDHQIFRTPNDIVVPAKKATKPGQINVTVIADQAGQQYNSTSTIRLTVPGLKSNAKMYRGVYAQSNGQIVGGFIGDQTGTDPAARATAIAGIRSRLQEKALQSAQEQAGANGTIFASLMQITYQDLPDTTESNGVGIHERAHIVTPIFPADLFAKMVGMGVTADAESASLTLVGGEGYTAASDDEASGVLGEIPFHFTLGGNAKLVWNIDTEALAKALAGRDQAAFKDIIANFPAIQEAHARIEPFWRKSFPVDPKTIKIEVSAPSLAGAIKQ